MNIKLTPEGLEVEGLNIPFTPPEGFNSWLKVKQTAFLEGVAHVYYPALVEAPVVSNIPDEEVVL